MSEMDDPTPRGQKMLDALREPRAPAPSSATRRPHAAEKGALDSCCYCGREIPAGEYFYPLPFDGSGDWSVRKLACRECLPHTVGGQRRTEQEVQQAALWLVLTIVLSVLVVLAAIIWATAKAGGAI